MIYILRLWSGKMKKNRLIILSLLLGFILCGKQDIFGMETGFSTETLSADETDTFLNNVSISMFFLEPRQEAIMCFDVNESGMIAIGTASSENKRIGIYSVDGDFKYGYKFNTSGSFGLEWDKDKINIYFVRSDVAVSVKPSGEIESVLKISNTMDNNTYWNHFVMATKRIVGDTEYVLRNDMGFLNLFASSYSQLIEIDANGKTKLIYDVNSFKLAQSIVIFVGVIVIISIAVFVLIHQFKEIQRKG